MGPQAGPAAGAPTQPPFVGAATPAATTLPRLMSLVVVGSIAFDAVKTPFGERERMLGGSAVHFSLAASFFGEVRVVGPVGDDFGEEEYAVLHGRGVVTDDIEHVDGGETFFWRGHYEYDLNTAHTDDTQLNVFGDFRPKLSEESKQADILFLANIQPDLQREVREQCTGARLAGLDSMNLWIDTARDSFAGGFLGYLASLDGDPDDPALRRAMTYGSVLASFNVEEFGTERVRRLTRDEIDERFEQFRSMTSIETVRHVT